MGKYKNIQELADAFKAGDLKDWVLVVDKVSTHLRWTGKCSAEPGSEEYEFFDDEKYEEGERLWDSWNLLNIYTLGQALTVAGIPNKGV